MRHIYDSYTHNISSPRQKKYYSDSRFRSCVCLSYVPAVISRPLRFIPLRVIWSVPSHGHDTHPSFAVGLCHRFQVPCVSHVVSAHPFGPRSMAHPLNTHGQYIKLTHTVRMPYAIEILFCHVPKKRLLPGTVLR